MKQRLVTAAALLGVLALSACASASVPAEGADLAGFWSGLWHGLTVGFAFVGSLFDPTIGLYEVNNNGGWYDFGFAIGVGSTIGAARR